jgi:predicted lipoprotein
MRRPHRADRPKIIGAVLLVVLVIAMGLSTRFVTPKELAAAGPQQFDAEDTAKELFGKARQDFAGKAAPLPDVVVALQKDTAQAATQFDAVKPNATTYVFPVTGKGTVTEATPASMQLKVDGVPPETTILVPLTTAINGTVLRDALGFKFADAPGQSDFQFVGDELKKLMQAEVKSGLGGAVKKGDQVDVVGVISVTDTGGPQSVAKPVSVQPISVKKAS